METSNPRDLSPMLIIIRGMPGSGKTYLTLALQEALGEDKLVVLDPDGIDRASEEYVTFSEGLSAEGVDLKLHPYRFSRARAHQAIAARKILIWNQPFIDFEGFRKTIVNLQTFASERNMRLQILVVEVEVDEGVAKERVVKRKEQGGHGPSTDTFARFASQYVSFADKGYTAVIVNGQDELSTSVSSVTQAIKELRS